jgi:hypothetical protein
MNLATREADTFVDVICADPQWVREEFDALISASFGEPPAPPPPAPPRVPPGGGPRFPPSRPRSVALPPAGTGTPARPGHRRQRSPPA